MSTTEDGWVPRGIDVRTPSTARMYDYYLGGKDNYEVDRVAAEEVLAKIPDAREAVQQNRAFLRASVRHLAEQGVRQFIDIGTGIPAQGAVHEVAHEVDPAARIVYVDNDPIVLVHARALMEHASDGVAVVDADMRDPDAVLERIDATRVIDFAEPVGVLFIAMLHFVSDEEDPGKIITAMRARMTPGSYLVMSHVTDERDPDTVRTGFQQTYSRATSQVFPRTPAEIRALFTGFELIEPGIVPIDRWQPGPAAEGANTTIGLCGVGIRT